jgi:spore maturation protein CgeB
VRIGLHVRWAKGSLTSGGNVVGDELYGESLCRALRALPGVEHAHLYAPNDPVREPLDVLVYLNETAPMTGRARKHVLYMQNVYDEGSDVALKRMQRLRYDGWAFISAPLLEVHRRAGYHGIYLPFGIDRSLFRPVPARPELAFETAYVGNDIKGEQRTTRFVLPAAEFRFGLFGQWKRRWFAFWRIQKPYQKRLAALTRGKIRQEDVPALYASSAVNVNCSLKDCVDWDIVTLRTLEVLACRGFLITDHVPAAERDYGGGLVFTEGGADMVEKIRHYLAHPDERARIAAAGHDMVAAQTTEARAAALHAYLKELV